ncbi:hypothetical protein [Rubrivirga marina]|uniref:Uncharacterized protein n=1 Tax=Rubrivirga marina TaxID=1196024 RepID=A0A271J0E4_9BACT|nr:hypothetical protein [Rubrivirga marina]PAP76981.1 hypothetical protein BSZ37_11330 [Rubrivirga marina]
MPVHLITYDLNHEREREGDYERLYAMLREMHAVKISESVYAADSPLSPEQVHGLLAGIVDEDDAVMVFGVSGPPAGQAPQEVMEWLRLRLG